MFLLLIILWNHLYPTQGQVVSNDGIKSDRSILSDIGRRWPNGIVPYGVHPNASSLAFEIKKGMDYIEKQTCVKFVKRNTETSFLYIIASEIEQCSSYVGYFSDKFTLMSLHNIKCNNGRTIQHELLHALGFTHEHTRPDRDNYMTINWDNIKEDAYREFYRYVEKSSDIRDCTKSPLTNKSECTREELVTTEGLPYDYGSIMHYSENAFSKSSSKTIKPIQKVPFGIEMGKARSLSYWDILKIRKAYNCSMCLTLGLKKTCKFPFKYRGKMYYTCTDVTSDTPWCATEVSEETKEYTEYDYCEPSCIECGTSNHPFKSCNQTTEGEKGTAQLEDYPWHVFILKWKEDDVKCEGAILTKHHVISAASCIKEYEDEILVIKTGSVDSEAFSTRYILYSISDKAYHPDYDSTTHENDIVILTAEFNIVPNINLIPVCLPQVSTHDFTNMLATYTGVDIPTISTHTKLGFLITKIVNDNQCQSSNTLCAKAINTSLIGNWGSPLVAKVDGSCALIGIHSKQTEGDGILKFTRIDRYLDWIKPRILHYYIVYKEYSFWESVNDEINGN
ncbi:uncharacterized protein [Lepeophtheirus salmonis]|nr:uncharacterized protein LOC121114533 [Lepeophtheirus salmonis]